ncbi:MAG: tRNA pseudouridine(38-40) synthase TruA [Nitrospirae bacterium]|nr:tRNA pseudouridine(38-40) synthase TruA [Nitrospirota bacterium]
MSIIKLTLEYDGRAYHGWQRQSSLPSVQAVVESAVAAVIGKRASVTGASRTDAGVHAEGQVATFHATKRLPPNAWQRALNRHLPQDIVVLEAAEVPVGFDARRSAIGKRYEYRLWLSPTRPALENGRAWHVPYPLSLSRIRTAARHLIGRHDYSAFQNADHRRPVDRPAICTIRACRIIGKSPLLIIQLEADRFLYKMARSIVGTLIEIGRGRWPPNRMAEILKDKDRRLAGPPAPACGLYLVKVYYGKERRKGTSQISSE